MLTLSSDQRSEAGSLPDLRRSASLEDEQAVVVTLLVVVRNEIRFIESALDCLLNQTYPKQLTEIILVDGISTDGTRELLEEKVRECRRSGRDVKLVENPKGILTSGWNEGIRRARGQIVCRIDAHSEVSLDYVEIGVGELLARRESRCAGIGGVAHNLSGTTVGTVVADLYASKFGAGGASYRAGCKEITETDTAFFALYWKKVFDEVGLFDERLERNQDIDFHARLADEGWSLLTDPRMRIAHSVRETLPALMKKGFLDGYWVVYSGGSLRHKIPCMFVSYVILCLATARWLSGLLLLPLLAYAVGALAFAVKDGRGALSKLLLPLFYPLLHFAYGFGTLKAITDSTWLRFRKLRFRRLRSNSRRSNSRHPAQSQTRQRTVTLARRLPRKTASEAFSEKIEDFFGGGRCFLLSKGRVGLYAGLRAMCLPRGSKVIMPGYTCMVVPSAVKWAGLEPVYVDINPNTYNIDPALLDGSFSSDVSALIAQHTYGIPCDMTAIRQWAAARSIPLIEDCCHTFGSRINGRLCGTFGAFSFMSGQWNKPFSTGLGGMLLVNDAELAQGVDRLIRKEAVKPGMARNLMLRMQIAAFDLLVTPRTVGRITELYRKLGEYGLVIGSSSQQELDGTIPPGYFSTMASCQIRRGLREIACIEENIRHRSRLTAFYQERVGSLGFSPLRDMPRAEFPLLRYPLRVGNKEDVLAAARRLELGSWFEVPLHPAGTEMEQFGYMAGMCPEAEAASDQVINLPTHLKMDEPTAEAILEFLGSRANPPATFHGISGPRVRPRAA